MWVAITATATASITTTATGYHPTSTRNQVPVTAATAFSRLLIKSREHEFMMCTEVAIVSLLEHRRNGMKFEPILFQFEGAHR
jgi:hypothetical protein